MSTVRLKRERVKAPVTAGGRETIKEPLAAPRPIPRTKLQVMVPVVIGVAFVGMIALMFTQPGLRGGTMGVFSLFFPLMMVMSLVSMAFMGRGAGGQKALSGGALEEARRDHLADLDERRVRMQEAAADQFKQFEFFHPEPALVLGLVGTSRMWHRSPSDPSLRAFFGHVRLGLGNSKLAKELEAANLGDPADYEPVTYDATSAFLQAQSVLRNAPKPVSLRKHPGLALIGEAGMEPVYGLARSMVCQAALAHSPNDFKIMVVTDNVERWDWVKWLPHCQHATECDAGGSARMVWTSGEDMNAAVGSALHDRPSFETRTVGAAHWLVIDDRRVLGGDEKQWGTLTRSQGVAGVTFLTLADGPRHGVGFADSTSYYVSEVEVRRAGEWFCRPDSVDEATARAVARKMAHYHDAGDSGTRDVIDDKEVDCDLFSLIGIDDPANIDIERTWAATLSGPPYEDKPWGSKFLQIVVGADSTGAPVFLDFKESSQGGMGSHMVLVGTSGSGKSSFLATLVLSAALTHSPEVLTIAFFDFKGSTTAMMIRDIPNVVASMNNLKDDSLWIERMGDVVYGELERRKRLLDRAGVSEVAEYEYRRIHLGQRLEPLPALIIIADEFAQMFREVPEARKIFDEVGRQGRALHVGMILGSQSLGHEMQGAMMANIPMRVALRTLDGAESAAVIGTDEAKHLPEKPPGAGLLRVQGRRELVRFQASFVRNVYKRPRRVAAETVRAQAGYVAPEVFTAEPMQGSVAAPAPAPQQVIAAPTDDVVLGPDGQPIRQIEAAIRSLRAQSRARVHQMWLPPLHPLPVDELVRRLRRKPWYEDYGTNDRLLFPVGLEDRPFQHAQRVYAVDFSGGNGVVVGQKDSGKTTALATMITGAALLYTPQRVQFYVLALGGPILNELEELPHVGLLARSGDRGKVLRTIAEMKNLVEEREDAFSRLNITIDHFRARKFGGDQGELPDDPFGEVFLVIDGWQEFRSTFGEEMVDEVHSIMERGSAYGVRVILTANGWTSGGFPSWMTTLIPNNVELALSHQDDAMHNNREVAKKVPFGERELIDDDDDDDSGEGQRRVERVRGRGTSMNGYHFQAGLPQVSSRTGGLMGVREAAEIIREVSGVKEVAQVRMLPDRVGLDEVFGAWPSGHRRAFEVPFGISEVGLVAAVADFGRSPHLLFTGNPECGQTNALAAVAQSIMRLYRPDEAQIYVADPKNGLVRVVEGDHLGSYIGTDGESYDGYVYYEDEIRAMAAHVAELLRPRLPRKGASQQELAAEERTWSGPEIFIIVDNEETIAGWSEGASMFTSGGPALGPLLDLLERGREIGLHFVAARRLAPWGKAMGAPLVGQLIGLNVPTIVMDGPREEGSVMGVRPSRLPVGRGTYVTDKLTAPVQIALAHRP